MVGAWRCSPGKVRADELDVSRLFLTGEPEYISNLCIVRSPLLKTAFFANGPRVGRILALVGYAGIADLDQSLIDIFLDNAHVVLAGDFHPDDREREASSK